MRQGPNSRRSRGRGNGGGGGGGGGGGSRRQNVPLRHQTFDSNGPDVRIRGNAWQVHEKYLALARDASSSGDRVQAENYLQHAEHYFRIINQIQESENRQRGNVGGNGLGPQPSLSGLSEDEDAGDVGEETDGAADERAPLNA
ncbi:DUF4167 domain-containing protein [Roseomonas genomospecies 6]|uniref:DUF4167 domain-containing protein n=1 Tax=Roseomonas genomospecies 6 TaxID=214106 RepID=A0A9W7KPA7_9PROT|nr:DUF4167 domain-containing protein [Roseomonas genomospecies 6]KAA0676555.1 DUF4167 domain-containing protein [Roseomonas genomospecies 6]